MVRCTRLDYAPSVVLESAAMSIPSIVSENTSDELMQVFTESLKDIETVHGIKLQESSLKCIRD